MFAFLKNIIYDLLEIPKDELQKPKAGYFNLILNSLQLVGVDILEFDDAKKAMRWKAYTFSMLIGCIYYYTIAQAIDFASNLDDFGYSIFSLCYMIAQTTGLLKGTIIYLNRKSIVNYVKKFESGLFAANLERGGINENKYTNRAIKYSNFQAVVFYFFVIIIVSNRAVSAVLERRVEEVLDPEANQTISRNVKVLPYNIYLPFDTQKHYILAFFYQIYACTLYGFYIGAVDAMITGIMIHVKAQVMILKNSLGFIKERAFKMHHKTIINSQDFLETISYMQSDSNEKVPLEVQMYVTLIVRDVIRHHHEIIKLVEETERIFNIVILIQFLVSLLSLCLLLFQIPLYEVGSPTFISISSYLILMLFQLFIFCWNGNELSLESADIARAVYNSDWIQFNDDCQKSMMMMIMRTQRAFRLSAGKFVFLSLDTYTTIVRGSASYYLALRQVNE